MQIGATGSRVHVLSLQSGKRLVNRVTEQAATAFSNSHSPSPESYLELMAKRPLNQDATYQHTSAGVIRLSSTYKGSLVSEVA